MTAHPNPLHKTYSPTYSFRETRDIASQRSEPTIYLQNNAGDSHYRRNNQGDYLPVIDFDPYLSKTYSGTGDSDLYYKEYDPRARIIATPVDEGYSDDTKKRFWQRKCPWVVWILSFIQVVVFIAEIITNGVRTGSPIQTKPTFNPMVGPSTYVLINMGARFSPCMHVIEGITDNSTIANSFPCPNSTSTDTDVCSLSELCGFSGFRTDQEPNQWFRFIIPIFLHAGVIHIIFNLLLQLRLGPALERTIGHVRFFVIYMAAGIFGYIFGANFSPNGLASCGASGALFGILAVDVTDLVFDWSQYERPTRTLIGYIIEIILSFAIGLLPGIDNFAHIGGFLMGLSLAICLLRSPRRMRKTIGRRTRDQYNGLQVHEVFAGRKKIWYLWIIVRIVFLGLSVFMMAYLIIVFYRGSTNCSWCKYLNCLPVKDWCQVGYLTTTSSTE